MRFSLPSILLLAALVLAGCDFQGPEALDQQSSDGDMREVSTSAAQSSALFPGEIQINTDRTVTIRDLSGNGDLLTRKSCSEFNGQGVVRIETDGDFPSIPCSLRFVNNRSSALIYLPDTKRPLAYSLNQSANGPGNGDIILDYSQGSFSFSQSATTNRVEAVFLPENLRFGQIATRVRSNGRSYIDAPWSKTFGPYTLDHGRVETQYRRKGTATWHTASNNVSATSGVIRITPSEGDKTFEFRVVSLLDQSVKAEAEHFFDDPRVGTQQSSVSILGPMAVNLNEINSWTGEATAPSGASETGRTWRLHDGNSVVRTSSAQTFSHRITRPPNSQIGYYLTLDVTFSNGSSGADLLGIDVPGGTGGGGTGGGGGTDCHKGALICP